MLRYRKGWSRTSNVGHGVLAKFALSTKRPHGRLADSVPKRGIWLISDFAALVVTGYKTSVLQRSDQGVNLSIEDDFVYVELLEHKLPDLRAVVTSGEQFPETRSRSV